MRKASKEDLSDDLGSLLQEKQIEDLLKEGDVTEELEAIGAILESMDYDCRILLVAKLAYGISPVEIARVAQTILLPGYEQEGTKKSWFDKLFDPLGSQMKQRRDFCWKKFKKMMDACSHIPEGQTKRDSRRGVAPSKPNPTG